MQPNTSRPVVLSLNASQAAASGDLTWWRLPVVSPFTQRSISTLAKNVMEFGKNFAFILVLFL